MVKVKLKISYDNKILKLPCLILIKNIHNKVVYENKFNCLDEFSVFLTEGLAYKVYVIYNANILGAFSIYARNNESYNINLLPNKHFISIWLMDANYPNLKIMGGEVNLCQKNKPYR